MPTLPKYRAKPVIVTAHQIIEVGDKNEAGELPLKFKGGFCVAGPEMLARFKDNTVAVGDYVVIQEDGYIYLNPKDVFERKYEFVEEVVDEKAPAMHSNG